jgi:hypothetical protein
VIALAVVLVGLHLLGVVQSSRASTSRPGLSKRMGFSSCRTAKLTATRWIDRVTSIVGWPSHRREGMINEGLACEHLRGRMARPSRRLFGALPAGARGFTSVSVTPDIPGSAEIGRSGQSCSSSKITPPAGQGRAWAMSEKWYETRRTSPSRVPAQAGASRMRPVASPLAACPPSALKE